MELLAERDFMEMELLTPSTSADICNDFEDPFVRDEEAAKKHSPPISRSNVKILWALFIKNMLQLLRNIE